MSILLSCQSLSKSFDRGPLFHDITLGINQGDKIGLIGPNGAGKSTFMKILAGMEKSDGGTLSIRNHTTVSYIPQESLFPEGWTAEKVVLQALEDMPWDANEKQIALNIALSQVGLPDPSQDVSTLSGGWKKRLSIATALSRKPDLVLLDEPTNHLDIEGILWLENLLKGASFAFLVITHDRYFLEQITTTIVEINSVYANGFLRVEGNYSHFLERRSEYLEAQQKYEEALQSKVRREVEWLRRGPKARTTKAKFRVDEAHNLINELSNVRSRMSQVNTQIDFDATNRQTKELLVAENISKQLGDKHVIRGLDLKLTRKMRLGLVGGNGSGKTTLLRMLAGDMEPDSGELKRAHNLQVVYFRQEREPLDPEISLRRALGPEGDNVIYQDRQIHVAGWAKRFGFRTEQLETKVKLLSGGERARIAIATLMRQPADVLLLDEPTNDLDIETLEVLEQNLLDFPGALVLVTHDRFLLDRVCQVVLALDPEEDATFVADHHQWQDLKRERQRAKRKETKPPAAQHKPKKKKKLSYHEQREWDQIEENIMEAEMALEECQANMEDPDVVSDPSKLQEAYAAMQAAQKEVETLYARWAELEAKQE
ncbi:MAG: ABC transporter ATP-binding protein [Deltaproteobacteria bacterium]|nr:MAG: ABC transporter ATP-binding protein [Deltaproteobacteria bacterium]